MSREMEGKARERAKAWIGDLDFVSREEFEAVKALAAKARLEQEALIRRLAEVESRLGELESKAPATLAVSRAAIPPGDAS
jgi:BMFP domain-containing protein YqiC